MPIAVKIYNQKAEEVGTLKLSDKVFGTRVEEALVYQGLVTQMANERQVLAHTKVRSEVRGGGRKPWRQKGTGRARAGSIRSPIWIGGGVTFGPRKERNFKKKINKKMRQKAILMVLSDKVKNYNLLVLDKLEVDEYKTKVFNEILTGLEKVLDGSLVDTVGAEKTQKAKPALKEEKATPRSKNKAGKRSVLVISEKKDEKIKYSARNLVGIKMLNLENINIVDLLKYKNLILTKESIKRLEEKYK